MAIVAIQNIEAHPDPSIFSRRCNRLWQSQQPNLYTSENTLRAMLHQTLLQLLSQLHTIKCHSRAEDQVHIYEVQAETQS